MTTAMLIPREEILTPKDYDIALTLLPLNYKGRDESMREFSIHTSSIADKLFSDVLDKESLDILVKTINDWMFKSRDLVLKTEEGFYSGLLNSRLFAYRLNSILSPLSDGNKYSKDSFSTNSIELLTKICSLTRQGVDEILLSVQPDCFPYLNPQGIPYSNEDKMIGSNRIINPNYDNRKRNIYIELNLLKNTTNRLLLLIGRLGSKKEQEYLLHPPVEGSLNGDSNILHPGSIEG
ncbi:MAG: hypothetical protein ABI721_00220 [Candidatus Dojkabacteria bacterium]